VTNGWLLSEARLKSLLGAGLTKIRLGVDSLERPKSRPTATTGGTVRPILEVIDMVLSQGIEMELNVVLTQYNRREVPNLIAFCRDRSLSAKFFERVEVARFASFRDAALMRSLPMSGFPAFMEAAKAIDPSLKVAEVAPLGGANELIETNGARLRYCRFLCDFRMCYVTGTRIDADGVVYSCMRSSRDLRLSENQTLDRSREVIQQVAHGRCEQTVVECT
jgi:GTP 3',8-cyclase